jgi:hypothetical protein
MGDMNYQLLAQQLLRTMGVTTKSVVGSTPGYVQGFNQGGLFSVPGLQDGIFSALNIPVPGLQGMLASKPAIETSPIMGILTGFTPNSGSNPTGPCDSPKTVGLAQLCTQTVAFGRWSLQTPIINLLEIGKIVNNGVNQNITILNPPNLPTNNGIVPTVPGNLASVAGIVKAEISKILTEFAAGWVFEFGKQLYTGNPSNNTTGGGYKEFNGLNKLVNTGHIDADTGTLCPAADSFLKDFASANISGSANAANAASLVALLGAIARFNKVKARRHNLGNCSWAWVMSDMLFWEICQIWPCNYATSACTTTNTLTAINVNGMDSAQMRDDMYNNKYLMVNGERMTVITDDAITDNTSNGTDFTSDIYFLPKQVLSNVDTLFIEYFPYSQANGSLQAAQILAPDGSYSISDGGRFMWHKKPPANFCVQMLAVTEPRLRLLTPQIASRVLNVKYTPSLPIPSPWPGDYTYVAGGGSTNQPNFFDFIMP